ncbi:hypothetical protein V8C86DRAFT_1033627 [Haematococcus lacustris]
MRTAHKRAAEGETGDPAPSSDEEQQQHFSGKRIAVAAEVFDAVSQLDDGLRDKSKRSYVTQLKHYRWCESQEPRCDDQDIVNSATLYYIYVVKLHGLIKRLRCKPHPTPAEEQELDQLETGPGSAHLKVSALKQLHAALQKEYKRQGSWAAPCHLPPGPGSCWQGSWAAPCHLPPGPGSCWQGSWAAPCHLPPGPGSCWQGGSLVTCHPPSGSDSCWKWGKSFSHYNRGHCGSLSQPWCQKPEPWRLEQLQCVCQHSRSPQTACHAAVHGCMGPATQGHQGPLQAGCKAY